MATDIRLSRHENHTIAATRDVSRRDVSVLIDRLIPWIVATCVVIWALPRAAQGPVNSDAGQHATNGAMIRDFIVSGDWLHPRAFAQEYLRHYPALSIGYHPPLFHAVEGVMFTLFGVHGFVGRLTVALFAGTSAAALYTLVYSTHKRRRIALLSVICFFSLRLSQILATDIMLEFPMTCFVLLAIQQLRRFGDGFSMAAALRYAVLASLAIWTKQHAVFLGLVPFFLVVTGGYWRELRRAPLWCGAVVFGIACISLSKFMGSVVDAEFQATSQIINAEHLGGVIQHHITWYAHQLWLEFGLGLMIACAMAIVAVCYQRCWMARYGDMFQSQALYLAYAMAIVPVLFMAWQYDMRYLFPCIPAYIVLLVDRIEWLVHRIVANRQWAAVVATAVVLFGFLHRATDARCVVQGPAEAAQFLQGQQAHRVLLAGFCQHQVTFGLRALQKDQPTLIVLRETKIPPELLSREKFAQFAHDYGIEYVVVGDDSKSYRQRLREKLGNQFQNWERLFASPVDPLQLDLVQTYPMRNSYSFLEGEMRVYRFRNPSTQPKSELPVWIKMMNQRMTLDLGASTDGRSSED